MKVTNVVLSIAIAAAIFYGLAIGRDLLVPFVIAVVLWYLLNVLAATFQRVTVGAWRPSYGLSLVTSLVTFGGLIFIIINLIARNTVNIIAVAPDYQKNLERLIAQVFEYFGGTEPLTIAKLIEDVNVDRMLYQLVWTLTDIIANAALITIYLIFLLLEQKGFNRKLAAFFDNRERETLVRNLIRQIDLDIQAYVRVKALVSLVTALISYAVMMYVDLPFADFWAFLIFFLNFIPTIGSIVATIFPCVLALVQFETLHPFFIVAISLTTIQFFVGYYLDPRLVGKSLNLSPLVVLLSLTLWGGIWGLVGLFIGVPITAVFVIICSHFAQTRPIAILLSGDGKLDR
jgi:AI-2 transport protein TqsA